MSVVLVVFVIFGALDAVWAQEKLLNIQCDRMQCISDDGSYLYRRSKFLTEKKFHLVATLEGNWFKAMQHCIRNDMRFATVTCKEEETALKEMLSNIENPPDRIWVGGTNNGGAESNSGYYWVTTGQELTYGNWVTEEFDPKPCIMIDKYNNWKLTTEKCQEKHFFLCEFYM